jgi:hypothetical protein
MVSISEEIYRIIVDKSQIVGIVENKNKLKLVNNILKISGSYD